MPAYRDARLADFLDDKLQTAADLHSLDDLLSSVRDQHALLQRQLHDAERALHAATATHQHHRASLERRGEQYVREQADIDRRLRAITQSETGDDAFASFSPVMDKLHRLAVAENYIGVMRDVDDLSTQCTSHLGTSDRLALDAYHRLQTFHLRLHPLQDAADGATPFLVDHVAQVTQSLHDKIRSAFAAQLEGVLQKASWPGEDAAITPALQGQWEESVGKLLELQKPELEARDAADAQLRQTGASNRRDGADFPIVLLPLQVMAQPIELKFRYHFEGDKPTNKLDRPEYFLQFITDNVLSAYNGFVVDNVQPLLVRHFKGSDLSMNPVYIDAASAFITAILPMVRHKVYNMVPRVASQPQLLSLLIHELIKFDSIVRDDWAYTGGYGVDGWKGLTWEVLVLKDWFSRWLEVEKDFALAQYNAIVNDPKSFTLDFESFLPTQTVPTKAAIRVNNILESITDTYRSLSSFSHKLRFLIDVQLSIFDRFHERLHDSLEAYLGKVSLITGVGKDERNKLAGVEGLESLCKVYGSAEYLEKAMLDWSDDVFFLDLYAELQDRAQNHDGRRALAGGLSVAQVAQKTSNAVAAEDDKVAEDANGGTGGALFDETAAAYSRLRVRSEDIIAGVLQQGAREALRNYRTINPWASLSSAGAAPSAPTPELTPLIDYARTCLTFLRRALGTLPLRRITRQLLSAVEDELFKYVLLRKHFSTLGAAQLSLDVGAIVGVVQHCLGAAEGDRAVESVVGAGMGKLLEGVQLVSLPVRGSGGGDADADATAQPSGSAALGLFQVNRRIYVDNESARAVLEELGMERLGVSEARDVFRNRIEVAG